VHEKIKVVYNGAVDSSTLHTEGVQAGSASFCIASRLVKDKGIAEAIDAFSRVITKYPNATLTILGDGPDREIFLEQAKHIPNITFLGHQKEPLPHIAASSIFIHP